jgi:hypothetical protein
LCEEEGLLCYSCIGKDNKCIKCDNDGEVNNYCLCEKCESCCLDCTKSKMFDYRYCLEHYQDKITKKCRKCKKFARVNDYILCNKCDQQDPNYNEEYCIKYEKEIITRKCDKCNTDYVNKNDNNLCNKCVFMQNEPKVCANCNENYVIKNNANLCDECEYLLSRTRTCFSCKNKYLDIDNILFNYCMKCSVVNNCKLCGIKFVSKSNNKRSLCNRNNCTRKITR